MNVPIWWVRGPEDALGSVQCGDLGGDPVSLKDDFKTALAAWASGVSVVTTNADGMLYGLTVSSFTSLSLDPPLVLVCLNKENRLPEMIEASGGFAVSILHRGQQEASNYFASRGRQPTEGFTDVEGLWTSSSVEAGPSQHSRWRYQLGCRIGEQRVC